MLLSSSSVSNVSPRLNPDAATQPSDTYPGLDYLDRRLAQQTKLLKERNASLLRAVASVKQNPSSSTVFVPGTGEECVSLSCASCRNVLMTQCCFRLQEPRPCGIYLFT